jgi:formate--tetrahydrofolate ligase
MTIDLEIARAAKLQPITDISKKVGIPDDAVLQHGPHIAKISLDRCEKIAAKGGGKLILVTAITPTPAGEGKTTTTVGLGDALNRIGKKAMICIREPSLGPVF